MLKILRVRTLMGTCIQMIFIGAFATLACGFQSPGNSGGGGGGGSGTVTGVTGTAPIVSNGSSTTPAISLRYDPTLGIGTSHVLGFNVTPEQYGALGNVMTFAKGAMDNNSTANLTDATNTPFLATMCQGGTGCTGANGNYLVCVGGASTTTVTDVGG